MVEFWRFGGTPQPAADAGRIAKRLEDLGWDGLVVGEDAGVIAESYVYLSAAAACTSTLKLGTGVSVPLRHPIQAASAAATLQAISNGRFVPSYGRGDGGLAILGRAPLNVAQFFAYVRQVKAYLDHEVVSDDGFEHSMQRLFDTDPSIDAARVPIDISATGPKMIAQAAQFADGVTFAVGADLGRLRQCAAWAREACASNGRDPSTCRLSAYIPLAVVPNGNRAWARQVIRGGVLRHARFSAFDGKILDGVESADSNTVMKAFEATRDHSLHAPRPADFSVADEVIDDEFLERFAIVGEPQECADRLAEVIDIGIERVVALCRVPTTDPHEENAARIAQEVFPLMAAMTSR